MNGNVATYSTTATAPMGLVQTVSSSGVTVQINASGTMQATGTFQFDFGPRTVNWAAASGAFSGSGNWDVGFAPRTSDTASIANGGSSSLSTIYPVVPAAVWIGNGSSASGTLTVTSGGSLASGGVVLGKNGGFGALYLNGGTLAASASNSQFLSGSGAVYVSTSGAVLNSNDFNVTIAQNLQTDPALGGAVDGGLVKTGNGKLILSGTDTFTGGTTVAAGTLVIMNSSGLADRSNITVGTASYFIAPAASVDQGEKVGAAVPVPEPGALALAGVFGVAVWLSRRRRRISFNATGPANDRIKP
jgi:autotransporter-associated beta strand protein